MKSLSNTILENGIKTLLEEDDSGFKKSLINSLSIKLNEAIKQVEEEFKNRIFESQEYTPPSDELKYFVEFIENYDPKLKNKLKLKNESYININEKEFESLVGLFENLSSKNRDIMVHDILENPSKLRSHINFYQKSRVIK
jgi:hypothetical protein